MKTTMKLFLAVTVLIFVSCGQSKKETTAKDVEKAANEALDATRDYASDKLGDLMSDFDKFTESAGKQVEMVKDEFNLLSDDLKSVYQEKLDALEKEKQEIDVKIAEYNEAADDKKEALKENIEQLNAAFATSLETFKKEMSDKK
jgi:ABC-type transporter Mla subunit MlaD